MISTPKRLLIAAGLTALLPAATPTLAPETIRVITKTLVGPAAQRNA